jgi:NAD+ kinase
VSGVALIPHRERETARRHVDAAAAWCDQHGIDFWVPPGDAAALDVGRYAAERPLDAADLVLSLGGDGTMLRSVRLLAGAAVPLLGVNLGALGYLTEVEPHDLDDALGRFFDGQEAGRWHLDERMMLDVHVNGDPVGRALNEAVVEKAESGHTVRLLASIDGAPFTYFAADGLIVATPTGSTAYSLSARGPIVSPRHRAILLTPVSPHMLFDRSLVLDPSEVVEIEVTGHRRAELALDGQPTASLDDGDVVRCAPSAATARFVRFGAERYHQILKAKFGLADR